MTKKDPVSWPVYICSALVGLGFLVFIIERAGFSSFLKYLLQARLPLIFAAIVLYAGSWCVRTARILMLVRFYGRNLPWLDLFRYSISGVALNSLLPANLGDVTLVGYLRTKNLSTGLAAAIVLQLRLLDAAAIALAASLLLPLTLGKSSPSWLMASLPIPLLVIGTLVLLIRLDHNRNLLFRMEAFALRQKSPLLRYVIKKIHEVAGGFHDLLKSSRSVFGIFLLSVFVWFMEGLTTWCISKALGCSISPPLLFLALYVANLGKALPLTPGGLGVYEGLMTAVLALGGTAYSQAIPLAVIDHLLKKIFNLAIGIPSTVFTGYTLPKLIRSLRQTQKISEPDQSALR
jgi:glycosyltransferase AglD